jgi:L-ribulose-5-phosphate 3-epimerase
MQGRLLPKYKGRFQAHPLGYWKDEFYIASEIGLQCIEFIFDFNDYQLNPLWTVAGLHEIQKISKDTEVKVYSVCADFFMECPFHSNNQNMRDLAISVAKQLMHHCNHLGVSDIVIPCVDHSSLRNQDQLTIFIDQIRKLIPLAENLGLNLALETDLGPNAFNNLLEQFKSTSITVNYDTGNSASLGFDYKEELDAYGSRISDLHIKDRLHGGGSVTLGTGDVDIEGFLEKFDFGNFTGPIILQCFRDDEGITLFQQQLNFFQSKLYNLNLWKI